ncbi:TetR family transcriptional regulator [Thiopseudomonas alkaliphila]|uniref:TetR family transcriptional regulator n=1 Tax=Thiopseudomonas alkaliphila TaxID=1697053 RepID=A0A0K1XGN1_9GAMM|nr:TetR/AcrR family transcriptional regulator [Thiopseudomonas alkaliphila]AKX43844.1 TetR family transcriptional regulator [Thiopseudomonas alkaliphila]AKX60337.1 TetR family transcriptional regulator [Thiopseudomonas alkaliphila]MDM1695087.1 TetR/AcrR family transcriptional regulator [Thiopseudomonas alkaliphila]MDM1707290.1 TetR/AcrR family transcriptional regulator [Thiopseudomonas alkaliphila]MDM1717165.1 TetR/AcrR family transcriptional regulator [Thiopseudomonas alkaliphila]
MAQATTMERILDAAELLFADKGFEETSLRTITSKAKVNLAAVNYHFGSKKTLIQAVFSRFLDPFCQGLGAQLDALTEQQLEQLTLEDLLALLVKQMLAVEPRSGNDLSIFMRLLGLAFSQSQGHLRRYLQVNYHQLFKRYTLLLVKVAPNLPPLELFWRIHFMMGSAVFSMSGIKALRAMAENDFRVQVSVEQVLNMMVPFMAAGLRAESSLQDPQLKQAQVVRNLTEGTGR